MALDVASEPVERVVEALASKDRGPSNGRRRKRRSRIPGETVVVELAQLSVGDIFQVAVGDGGLGGSGGAGFEAGKGGSKGIDGLVTPSARHVGTNLPVFTRESISNPNVEAIVALTYNPDSGEVAFRSQPMTLGVGATEL